VTVNETAFKVVTKEEYCKNSRVLSKYFNIKISNLFFVSTMTDVFEVAYPCITVLSSMSQPTVFMNGLFMMRLAVVHRLFVTGFAVNILPVHYDNGNTVHPSFL
jgi:hypothetical protein